MMSSTRVSSSYPTTNGDKALTFMATDKVKAQVVRQGL